MSRNLTYEDRIRIETMLKDGLTQREIAKRLNRHYNTINYEIKRGRTSLLDGATWKEYDFYSADIGQQEHDKHSANKGRDLKIGSDIEFADFIEKQIIEKRYSPYAALCAARGRFDTTVCTTTLYSYIHKGIFYELCDRHLTVKKKPARTRRSPRRQSLKNLNAKSITERPERVNDRSTFGEWELDTVVGGNGKGSECLMVLTERMTRGELLFPLGSKTMSEVVRAFDELERGAGSECFISMFATITADNGSEFLDDKGIERSCLHDGERTAVYYCHPYCPSERGSNENLNKLVRRWFPKGCAFSDYSPEYIAQVQEWLNTYPRKIFGGRSARDMGFPF